MDLSTLSQDELKLILSALTQIPLMYNDSKRLNVIIEKIDSFVVKPKIEDVVKQPVTPEVVPEAEVIK